MNTSGAGRGNDDPYPGIRSLCSRYENNDVGGVKNCFDCKKSFTSNNRRCIHPEDEDFFICKDCLKIRIVEHLEILKKDVQNGEGDDESCCIHDLEERRLGYLERLIQEIMMLKNYPLEKPKQN